MLRSKLISNFKLCKFHQNLIASNNSSYLISFYSSVNSRRNFSWQGQNFYKIGELWYLSEPVQRFSHLLISVHDYTSLPWYATIILCTTFFRTAIVFPFMVYDRKISARLVNLKPEMDQYVKNLNNELTYLLSNSEISQIQARKMFFGRVAKKRRDIYIRENVHPAKKALILFFQFPFWITMSSSLAFLCSNSQHHSNLNVFNSLTSEGVLWFKNLTQSDSTYILPCLFGFSMFANLEFSTLLQDHNSIKSSKFMNILMKFLKLWCVILIFFGYQVSSGVCLYWTFSCINGLIHNIILSYPSARRFLKIPQTKPELKPLTWVAFVNLMKKKKV